MELIQSSQPFFYGIEQSASFLPVLNVGVDEKAVHLAVNVFDGDLKPIEAPGLRDLDLLHEPFNKVFVNKSVWCCEECKDMGNEIFLIIFQLFILIFQILKEES